MFAARQTERFNAASLKRAPRRVHVSRRQTGQFAAHAVREFVPFCRVVRSGGRKRFELGLLRRLAEVKQHQRNPFLVAAMSREGRHGIDWPSLPASWGRGAKLNGGTAIQPCGRPGASRKSLTPFFLLFTFSFRPSRSWHLSHPNLHVRPHQGPSGIIGRCFI